jgi:hypothetical protein
MVKTVEMIEMWNAHRKPKGPPNRRHPIPCVGEIAHAGRMEKGLYRYR